MREGPRVARGPPKGERVRGEEQRRQGELRQRVSPSPLPPGEECEGRQEREAGRAGQQREPRRTAGEQELTPLGERERRQGQQQVERLRVHGLQEERKREDGEVQDRPPRAVGPEAFFCQSVQEQERSERGCEGDE